MLRRLFSRSCGVRWPAALVVAVAAVVLTVAARSRLKLDSDVISGLPARDPAMADTVYILSHHEVLDSVYLDLSLASGEPEAHVLADAADHLSDRLEASGLFRSVGTGGYGEGFARLLLSVAGGLPRLFEEEELRSRVAALLSEEGIRSALAENAALLRGLEGVGQAGVVARDPLGLRNIILARMGMLLPDAEARIYRGHVLSADGRHLLLPALPKAPGTDTVSARRIAAAIDEAAADMARDQEFRDRDIRLQAVGAYRNTLDNEDYARADAQRAAWLSLAGIALVLFFVFPRPQLGLLCLVPAMTGTLLSLFTLSLFRQSISILALGFGGALVGIAVDQGIAYFIFLDRERRTTGWEASRSVWVVSLASTLTTVGSFLALQLSGFAVLRQLGLFAALGVLYAFLFVHLVFPLIFASVAPARRRLFFRLETLTSLRILGSGRAAAWAAVLLFAVLAVFAKPRFQGDLKALNTVSPETLQAEEHVSRTWGDVVRSVFLMVEGDSPEEMLERSDRVSSFLRSQTEAGKISAAFTPALVFPGPEAAARRQEAWRRFWTPERIGSLRSDFRRIQGEYGFSPAAFEPFFRELERPVSGAPEIPEELLPLLGVSRSREGTKWMALSPVAAGPGFDREEFFAGAKAFPGVRVLDYSLFADRFAGLLVDGFFRMLLICIGGLALVLLVFFGELTLPSLVLGHTLFALTCTLGTLNLLGQPMNIPGLAVAIIVPGMGSDFAIFFTRSFQRHLDERHPALALFRNAVLLTSTTALIGFGALALSRHVLLHSIGLTGLLAIGYSALGAFLLLPPLLRRVFRDRPWPGGEKPVSERGLRSRVMRRFRHLEVHPRQFARFKMLLDPMFPRLRDFAPREGTMLDIGCGYGVPSAWLLAQFPGLRIHGLDPDAKRLGVARHVFGSRGTVTEGAAPELPPSDSGWEGALMLDVAHHLSDGELGETLSRLAAGLRPGGRLVMRATVPRPGKTPWLRRVEGWRLKRLGREARYRNAEELSAALQAAGFRLELIEPSKPDGEEFWLVAALRS